MHAAPAPGLTRLILGSQEQQRIRVKQTLLADAAYCAFITLHVFEVWSGLMAANQFAWLAAFCVAGMVLFYLIIRSGLNLRLSKDPSLTMQQQIFAMVAVVWTYAVAGADRGATIGIMVLILMFGAFRFRTSDMMRLSCLTLLMLAAVMLWQCWAQPAVYPADVAVYHFLYAALAIWPIYVLTAWRSRLQADLAAQKTALEEALERIRRLADRDELTGLINRRAMLPMLKTEMQTRHPAAGRVCIALIDIDMFKTINDRFGHQAGDESLRQFARVAKMALRTGDIFSRWGGEEFLLMMPDTSVMQGAECLERLRALLAATSFAHIHPELRITLSAGVTDLHPQDRLEAALERADQAMYKAKQQGRDQVVMGRLHARLAG